MNRLKFLLGLVTVGAVCSASAQLLQFTNLTLSTSPNLFHGMTNRLNGVVYGGDTNFVAVGANQIYVCGNFQPGQTWFTNGNWVTNQVISTGKLSLDAVTIGANLFVATGQSNYVFSAVNNFGPGGLTWTKKSKIFSDSITASAITYNGNGFVAAGESPQIGWSGTNLPTSGNWSIASLSNPDFIEAFYGVTPYGANGFAVCGAFADVRLSANGTNWQSAVSGKTTLPNLYGIAYDGVRTLVSVGVTNASSSVNGVIMASTNNSGTNWQTVYVNNTSGTPLNAVTYTGSGFMAVGNKGLVLTSPDGVTWTVLTNAVSPATANLYGVAYAQSGYMVGVGEIVGDSGAVILLGTPPPAPINPVGETNCATYPNSPAFSPLSITPVTDANHPAGTVAIDWYDAQGNLVAADTTNLVPTINPDTVGMNVVTNLIFYAKERDLRTGFTATNSVAVTLQLVPRPTATMPTSTTDVCNTGASYTLTNTLTGIGPWTVYWNDGTIQTAPQTGPGPVILTRVITPANPFPNAVSNNVYYVTVVTNADMCEGNAPGDILGTNTIVVYPLPTASLTSFDTTNCNDGTSFALTNVLTGIGPWVVTWNDGSTQTLAQAVAGPVTLARTVYPTNSAGANAANNNVYYVSSVSSANTCQGVTGGITGTNIIVINPRPTAALAHLNVTNCNDGTSFILTNTLTGIGPWTVTWNDGTVQSTLGVVSGPVILGRTVYPTNSFGANTVSNNIYYVTSVANADTCSGNEPGDILGTNLIVINPRPTATLSALDATNCNSGTSYTLTNTLTGIGPWTVIWNDGTIQTNSLVGAGPATLTRVIAPTNNFANAASNNVYYVSAVVNADTCSGNEPGDILGTNLVVINPLPTATLTISPSDFGLTTNGTPSGLLESITQPQPTNYNLVVGFQALSNGNPYGISNQVLSITNHLAFTGLGQWNVTLSDGTSSVTTNYTANGIYVWNETITTNADKVFTFSITSVLDTNTLCSGSASNHYSVIVYDAPTAAVAYSTNTLCGSGAEGAFTISATLGGFGPWTNVVWSDGYTNSAVSNTVVVTRPSGSFTNHTFVPISTNLSIVQLTDRYGATTTSGNDLTGDATVIVDPYLAFAPIPFAVTNYSCPGVGTPLSVSVPPGFTADWYADPTLLTNLAIGATNYIAVVANLSTNVYYVTMRYNDEFSLTNCSPDIATNIYLIAAPCSNSISSITLTGSSAVVSWYGNYILQSATNLNPPINWMNVSTGALGPNFVTNSILSPPVGFFRLYSPTN